MKKRLFVFLLVAVVLILPITGCLASGSANISDKSGTKYDQTQDERITKVETKIKELPNQSTEVAKLAADVAQLKAQPGGINPADITDLKAKVAAQQSSIDTLKAQIAALQANPSPNPTPTPTPTPTTGVVSMTTDPAGLNQLLGNSQYCFTMRITNGMSQWRYVKPIMTLSTSTPVVVTDVACSYTASGFNVTGTHAQADSGHCLQASPTLPRLVTDPAIASIVLIPIRCGSTNLGEFQIASGQVMDVLVCVTVTSASPAIWNISMSISDRGL